jgi:hypothetical protein
MFLLVSSIAAQQSSLQARVLASATVSASFGTLWLACSLMNLSVFTVGGLAHSAGIPARTRPKPAQRVASHG